MDYSWLADRYDLFVRSTLDIPFYLQETAGIRGKVLELMCGTGRVSLPLLEAGVPLTCVDLSADMLAVLRRKLVARGLHGNVLQMDVTQLDLGELYDLVILPFHAFAEITEPTDQQAALSRIYHHLVDGGRFICTLHNPPVRSRAVDGRMRLLSMVPFEDQGGHLVVWLAETQAAEKGLVRGLEILEEYDPAGLLRSKRMMELHYVLLDRQEFEELARGAGFHVVALYGDYSYGEFQEETSSFMVWVMQK